MKSLAILPILLLLGCASKPTELDFILNPPTDFAVPVPVQQAREALLEEFLKHKWQKVGEGAGGFTVSADITPASVGVPQATEVLAAMVRIQTWIGGARITFKTTLLKDGQPTGRNHDAIAARVVQDVVQRLGGTTTLEYEPPKAPR